jgi:hypothetical protein
MSTLRVWRSIVELKRQLVLPARIERTTQGSEPCAFLLRYGRVCPDSSTFKASWSTVNLWDKIQIRDANVFLKSKKLEEEEE